MSKSVSVSRPYDIFLDPTYIVSGPADYYKIAAQHHIAKYKVCPIFPTMFSDLRQYPRKQYVVQQTISIPAYIDKIRESKIKSISERPQHVAGENRYKHFQNPTIKRVPTLDFRCFFEDEIELKAKKERKYIDKVKQKSRSIQTVYRESSAQTSPWQPDYAVVQGDPELLKLDFLKWGAGLPAGVQEVSMIQRMRMKSKWMKQMPALLDSKSLEQRNELVENLERSEWIFREREIQDIQNLRLELLEKMLNEIQQNANCKNEKKLKMFSDMKINEKNKKLKKLHEDRDRERRRLDFNYMGVSSKYGKLDVFEEYSDFKSDLYMPLLRHGNNPRYGHQLLQKSLKSYKAQYENVLSYSTFPNWVNEDTVIIKNIKLPGTRLCIRETKWTSQVLNQLHEDLKKLGHVEKKLVNLRVRLELESEDPPTPSIEDVDNPAADWEYQSCVVVQRILRGRAVQAKIFQGRDMCRELIDELRSTFNLKKGGEDQKQQMTKKTTDDLLNANICRERFLMLETYLKKLGGQVIGTLLDFLNKELNRLIQERQIHAMALLLERNRSLREAAEGGRRQKEIRRRLEHDEIFKQCVKMTQESVDLYLQDIITEGMEFKTEVEATEYIETIAAQMDEEAKELDNNLEEPNFRDDYIAKLVHQFVIPEVEKTIVRQRTRENQRKHLLVAHEEICGRMETLPRPKRMGIASASSSYTSDYSAVREPRRSQSQRASSVTQQSDEDKRSVSMTSSELKMKDVQAILDELLAAPYKEAVLRTMKPCLKKKVKFGDAGWDGSQLGEFGGEEEAEGNNETSK